ncbi:MAG: hypothetical protein AB1597_01495 [Chloroflexota bacterium]
MKKALLALTVAVMLASVVITGCVSSAGSGGQAAWTEVSSKPVEGQPGLLETVWETERPPQAKYDKVGVRRLKSTSLGPTLGIIFFIPSSVTSARLYTSSEDHDFRLFLANRGYEIYSLDYRASFIPAEEKDLSSMAGWNTRVFLGDIEAAVALAKQKSGFSKVFLSGHSTGARYVYLYGALRWREDVVGLIPLDGSPWETDGPDGSAYTLDIDQVNRALKEGDTPANRALFKSWEVTSGPGYYEVGGISDFAPEFPMAIRVYYEQGPKAPSPVKGYSTVSDYIASQFQDLWGSGQFSNPLGGYASIDMLLNFALKASDPYWPIADYLDDVYIGNWRGKAPRAEYSYHEKLCQIDVPVIAFASGEWKDAMGMVGWWREMGTVMVRSRDTEYHLLEGFGHIDILLGEKARDQVFVPLLDWLKRRRP